MQRDKGVVTRDPRCICTGPNRHAHVHHSSERRRFFGSPGTVAIDEVLALESHAMLNRHPTAECFDAL
jgi:hypothetical protein